MVGREHHQTLPPLALAGWLSPPTATTVKSAVTAAAVKPAATIAPAMTAAVAPAIIAASAIDAATIGASSNKAGAVAVSADAIAPTIAARTVTVAIADDRRHIAAVPVAVTGVLTTSERHPEPRDERAQKNPTPNHRSLPLPA
jgi:hypothetical protein